MPSASHWSKMNNSYCFDSVTPRKGTNPLDFLPYARCLHTLSLKLIIAANKGHHKPHFVVRKPHKVRDVQVQEWRFRGSLVLTMVGTL